MSKRTIADLIIDALADHGVRQVWGVVGDALNRGAQAAQAFDDVRQVELFLGAKIPINRALTDTEALRDIVGEDIVEIVLCKDLSGAVDDRQSSLIALLPAAHRLLEKQN